jgi:hypothetical protein
LRDNDTIQGCRLFRRQVKAWVPDKAFFTRLYRCVPSSIPVHNCGWSNPSKDLTLKNWRSHDLSFPPTPTSVSGNRRCLNLDSRRHTQTASVSLPRHESSHTIPRPPSTVEGCRRLSPLFFQSSMMLVLLAPDPNHHVVSIEATLRPPVVDTSIGPINRGGGGCPEAMPNRRQPSPTSRSRSPRCRQIALRRPPRCLTVVSRIFVIPQQPSASQISWFFRAHVHAHCPHLHKHMIFQGTSQDICMRSRHISTLRQRPPRRCY